MTKIEEYYLTAQFAVDNFKKAIRDIATGYYNYWLAVFNLMDEEEVAKHDAKAMLCTKDCPLRGKRFGYDICDNKKEIPDGTEGCGCFVNVKLWSDSPCPRNLF